MNDQAKLRVTVVTPRHRAGQFTSPYRMEMWITIDDRFALTSVVLNLNACVEQGSNSISLSGEHSSYRIVLMEVIIVFAYFRSSRSNREVAYLGQLLRSRSVSR